jgi:hypothetical protein
MFALKRVSGRYVSNIASRNFSTANVKGESVEEILTQLEKDGKTYFKLETVTSTNKKRFLYVYAGLASVCYIGKTYNDGKQELLKYRKSLLALPITNLSNKDNTYNDSKQELLKLPSASSITNKDNTYNDEWNAVRTGCTKNSWDNFWDSLIFPVKAIDNLVPSFVMMLNEEHEERDYN